MRADLPTAFVSCFDKDAEDDKKGYFWKRVIDPKEIAEIEERPTLIEGLLNKNRLDADKEAHFVLKQGLIYYTTIEKMNDIAGIAKLSFQKIEVYQSSVGPEKIFGIRLFSGSSQTKLLSKDREQIVDWYVRLSPMLVNRDFFSKYELKEILGEGAFSQVYKVIEKSSGQVFAAKVIKHKMIYSDKRGVQLMKQEIDIMRQLDHKNIVKLFEVQEVNNAVILIMENLEGCELKKINPHLRFADIMTIIKSLVNVIAYLEGLDIVHRDLKLSNIMILGGGTGEKITKASTKIIDFGLAAFLTEKLILTKCGTPGYIAPEILNQSSRDKIVVNPNVDVYSLGIILYEMIYKCNPFKESVGKNESKKVVRRNAQSLIDYSKPTSYQGSIDQRVIDLIKEMSHRDERERPLASKLLMNPVIMKGTSLWRNSDYHPLIEENAKTVLLTSPYVFKVNKSKLFDIVTESQKKIKTRYRPPMLNLDYINPMISKLSEDQSPGMNNIMSPLDNKHKYKRETSTKYDRQMEPNSAASLDKRFRGAEECDSPLMPGCQMDVDLVMNSSRNTFRTSSVGKQMHKSQLTSTKKNTGYEANSSYRGGLFVLQRCINRDDKPSYYN